MPPNRTHDTSLVGYHIKDLKTFGDILTSAVSAAFPNSGIKIPRSSCTTVDLEG
jgi:hypothetical protein